jgi:hypothetical protein
VLYLTQGTSRTDSEWIAFGWMVLMVFGFRMMVLFFMFHPVDRLTAKFQKWWSGGLEEHILAGMISLRRIEGQLVTLIAENTSKNSSIHVESTSSVNVAVDTSHTHEYDELFDESSLEGIVVIPFLALFYIYSI